jgi:hypothetical protein
MDEQLPCGLVEGASREPSLTTANLLDSTPLYGPPADNVVPEASTPLYGPPSDGWQGGYPGPSDSAGILDLISDIYYNPQEYVVLIVIIVKLVLLVVGAIVFIGLMLKRRRSK